MSLSSTLTSNLLHSKYVSFISLLIEIHKFIQILINDSSDSNHSSTFTVLVVATFTKKEEIKTQIQQAKPTHNILLSIAVFVYES